MSPARCAVVRRSSSPVMLGVALALAAGCQFRVDGAGGAAVPAADLAVNTIAADLAPPIVPDLSTPPDLAPPAHVTVSVAPTAGTIDLTMLTAAASSDWAHWGFAKVTDVDRKASGNAQISAVSVTGNGVLQQYMMFPTAFTWSDGATSNGSHPMSPGSSGGVYVNAGGLSLTMPAGVAARRVVVYVSYCDAQARMQVALGDHSAAGYDDSSNMSNDDVVHDLAYTIDYSAASDGQTLTIGWSLAANDVGTKLMPAVALEAATLGAPAAK